MNVYFSDITSVLILLQTVTAFWSSLIATFHPPSRISFAISSRHLLLPLMIIIQIISVCNLSESVQTLLKAANKEAPVDL